MNNTEKQAKKLAALAKTLRKAQAQAAALAYTLSNGGELDAIIGSLADEIEVHATLQRLRER